MYICECERICKTPQGLGYHKRYCGKIGLDGGYEYYINKEGNLIYIHREVLEKKLGRKREQGEFSHHIDENKRNNDPNNLELKTRSEHGKHHYEVLSNERKVELSKSAKGKPSPHKGKINRFSLETKEKMSKSHKGQIPWNKGIIKNRESAC